MGADHRPVLAGLIALACFGVGGSIGTAIAWAAGAPGLMMPLAWAGAAGGYLAGRTVLRRLFTRWMDERECT